MPKCNSIKLICNLIEITCRHECSSVNLSHIFRTPFYKNTYGGVFLCFTGGFLRNLFFLERMFSKALAKSSCSCYVKKDKPDVCKTCLRSKTYL